MTCSASSIAGEAYMLNLKVFSFLNIASIEIQHATLIKNRGSENFPVFISIPWNLIILKRTLSLKKLSMMMMV
jgi:hypothetical protein